MPGLFPASFYDGIHHFDIFFHIANLYIRVILKHIIQFIGY